jgi:hypothetical protein
VSSVVHQSQEPSAAFPLDFKTSATVAVSNPRSSRLAVETDIKRENAVGSIADFGGLMCRRTADLSTLPCDPMACIARCIFFCIKYKRNSELTLARDKVIRMLPHNSQRAHGPSEDYRRKLKGSNNNDWISVCISAIV